MTAATITAESGQMQGSLSARCALAAANALMAMVVGTLTLGAGVGVIAALVLGILPFTPFLPQVGQAIVAWAKETPLGACLGVFLLCWILGSIIWGLHFAFSVALVLAPVSLTLIVAYTLRPDNGD
jgi:hypothetical protein